MYKVLLADDERSVIDSMLYHIPWQQHGLEVVYTAADGRQAYEYLLSAPPDIAILDIRMPGYSGLELSRLISQKNLKTQVIIVSGYAEFSYAQKAIQYGVMGYCLKPVEYEEINSLLLKAIHHLEQNSHNITTDDFLNALENNDIQSVTRYLQESHYVRDNYYLAATICDTALQIPNTLTFRIGPSQYGYLSDIPMTTEAFSGQPQVTGIGIYPEPAAVNRLGITFHRCLAMAYQYFIEPGRKLCNRYYEFHSLPLTTQLKNAVFFSEKERLERLLTQLIAEGHYRLYSVHSAQQIYNLIVSNHNLVGESRDYYIYNYRQLVNEYGSFRNMIESLVRIINAAPAADRKQADLGNSYFLKIIKYINTYYSQNISLKDVAKVVNLNPNYISQVFKKSAGTTFSQYLVNLRITQAKKLLTTTNFSINEISLQSGFNDYFYFLKTFKKYTGETPSEYRNQHDRIEQETS